jgi:thiol-disulfide isomerase/thioredoxin
MLTPPSARISSGPGPCLLAAARLLAATCLLALTGGSLLGQPRPDTVMSGFEPTGEYVLEQDGKVLADAKLYLSRRAAAVLITAPRIGDPLLVWARSARVDRIAAASLLPRTDGGFDVAEGTARAYLGDFAVDGPDMRLPVAGTDLRLGPRPALVGLHTLERLLEHSPEYAAALETYAPDGTAVAKLAAYPREVRVRVFFGTWCGVCKAVLPGGLRVARELAGSRVAFEFYGLDHPPAGWQDGEARRLQVEGLPTAIVFREGREVGRFSGASGFAAPETALLRALDLR